MAKNLKMYEVSNISMIDKTLYNNGDVLVTDKGLYMFMKGKAESLHTKTDVIAFMKDEIQKMNYVTKDEIQKMNYVTKDEIQKMNYATKEEVTKMIEDSKGGV